MTMYKNKVISIIVPIYNAQKYLHRCVDSLLKQTYTNIEVILVDDGSSDNSGAICDEYADKDKRIKVIHQKNGGVSVARQTGIDESTGDYIIHADADDWVESDMISTLYSKAVDSDADVVFCDYYEDIKGKIRCCTQKPCQDRSLILKQLLFQQLHGSCCNKLIKRSCYSLPDVKFPKGLNIYEDLYVICQILNNDVKVAYVPKAFYHYVIVPGSGSLSNRISAKTIEEKKLFVQLMSKKQFTNEYEELFLFKKSILFDLFRIGQYTSVFNTYPEIHAQIIKEKPRANLFNPNGYILFQIIIGHLAWAQFFWKLSSFSINVKNKIK